MKHNPYKIVQMFEEELAEYTGAPYVVSVDSCTNGLLLCCLYHSVTRVTIPKKTYVSVPGAIIHAGGTPIFEDREWQGAYQLSPYPIWDAAKRFTSGMYMTGQFMCLSFHAKKRLGIEKGGAILCPTEESAIWFKKMRYEGRSEKMYHEDNIDLIGYNCYMQASTAARGLVIMQQMPKHNDDIPEGGGYRDLTEFPAFKKYL
jgi:dTDP-4-amino-4,6-dideoxygalactose transaminase